MPGAENKEGEEECDHGKVRRRRRRAPAMHYRLEDRVKEISPEPGGQGYVPARPQIQKIVRFPWPIEIFRQASPNSQLIGTTKSM